MGFSGLAALAFGNDVKKINNCFVRFIKSETAPIIGAHNKINKLVIVRQMVKYCVEIKSSNPSDQ